MKKPGRLFQHMGDIIPEMQNMMKETLRHCLETSLLLSLALAAEELLALSCSQVSSEPHSDNLCAAGLCSSMRTSLYSLPVVSELATSTVI